jgi:hypothetical protein
MHKPRLELLIRCASFVSEVLKAFVWSISPTLILVPVYSNKRNKVETNKGSASFNTREPKFYSLYYYVLLL